MQEGGNGVKRKRILLLGVLTLTVLGTLLVGVPQSHGAHVSPTVVATVSVGDVPEGVGVNPTTDRVYVANKFDDTVSVIDGASNTVIATVPVGDLPQGVAVNPTSNRIYVANTLDDTVSVIDGASNAVVESNTVVYGTIVLHS